MLSSLPVKQDPSALRQRLRRLEDQRASHVEQILDERGALIRGALGTRARVCGKPNCHCSRGERHVSKFLSAAVGGRTRQVHVPAGDEVAVAAKTARYRRARHLRGELADLGKQAVELVDALHACLLEPYPPHAPLPPPQRRGRKRKDDAPTQQ